jgi:hypothetical protein
MERRNINPKPDRGAGGTCSVRGTYMEQSNAPGTDISHELVATTARAGGAPLSRMACNRPDKNENDEGVPSKKAKVVDAGALLFNVQVYRSKLSHGQGRIRLISFPHRCCCSQRRSVGRLARYWARQGGCMSALAFGSCGKILLP